MSRVKTTDASLVGRLSSVQANEEPFRESELQYLVLERNLLRIRIEVADTSKVKLRSHRIRDRLGLRIVNCNQCVANLAAALHERFNMVDGGYIDILEVQLFD